LRIELEVFHFETIQLFIIGGIRWK
jgi:hypothetical protein